MGSRERRFEPGFGRTGRGQLLGEVREKEPRELVRDGAGGEPRDLLAEEAGHE